MNLVNLGDRGIREKKEIRECLAKWELKDCQAQEDLEDIQESWAPKATGDQEVNLEVLVLAGSKDILVIRVKGEPSVSLDTLESWATLVQLGSEEFLDQKETQASLVQTGGRGFLDSPDPRVFQERMELQETLGLRDFLVYRDRLG